MEAIIQYLIRFLIGTPNALEVASTIGYTANANDFAKYKLIILPSGFFNSNIYGKPESIPTTPLLEFENCPLLFGKPLIEKHGESILLHADLIASSYFLMSRYEEWVRTDGRDIHGRFMGTESIAYKGGFINRPIIEEYGKILRRILREIGVEINEPQTGIAKVYLTHDVDQPFLYQNYRSLLSSAYRSLKNKNGEFKTAFNVLRGNYTQDPAYVFRWILERNTQFAKSFGKECETILFFKSAIKVAKQDKPTYSLQHAGIVDLFKSSANANIKLGLHNSYQSAHQPELIAKEKKQLENACQQEISYTRYHYLRSKKITDFNYLIEAGITDDFTMGYADVAGFRLGTCRATKWINPATKTLTNLNLHPLVMMDISLTDKRYMNLSYPEALIYCKKLINQANKYQSEISLLWHNNALKETDIVERNLYQDILNHIQRLKHA